jgi:hypothetical protein
MRLSDVLSKNLSSNRLRSIDCGFGFDAISEKPDERYNDAGKPKCLCMLFFVSQRYCNQLSVVWFSDSGSNCLPENGSAQQSGNACLSAEMRGPVSDSGLLQKLLSVSDFHADYHGVAKYCNCLYGWKEVSGVGVQRRNHRGAEA